MASVRKHSVQNPFSTYTNWVYPRTMQEVFDWAKWFWNRNHKYRTAIQKIVTYFVAGIDVSSLSKKDESDTDQLQKFKDLLLSVYDLLPLTVRIGEQLAAMGNVFVSAQRLFTRDLCCPRKHCGFSKNIERMSKGTDYTWQGGKFKGVCQQCGKSVQFVVRDTAATAADGSRLRFCVRSASDMRLRYNALTGDYSYIYKIPDFIKKGILAGKQIYLRSTPMLYIQAALKGDFIQFDKTKFFFMRTETLSELDELYQGWGIPLFLASFGNLLRLATLDRFNQAVVMQYIAPMRLLSPPPELLKAGADPSRSPVSGNFFKNVMTRSLTSVRSNPSTWVVSPFPVQYQMLGGQAKQMAPVQLMEWYTSQILSDMGVPAEFKQTSFQITAPTMGLRVFQRMWLNFAKSLNKFVKFAANLISDAHSEQHYNVTINMTSFVEDDMNKQVRLQLTQAGLLSKQAGLQPFGIDYKKDLANQKEQQQAQMQRDMQMQAVMQGSQMVSSVVPPAGSLGVLQAQQNIQAMQAAAQGGMPAPPGSPAMPAAPAPPGAPASPDMPFGKQNSENATMQQLYSRAQQQAQRIHQVGQQFGATARRQQINKLRSQDKILHAQVMSILQSMDSQVASQAIAQSKGPQE